MAEIESSIEGIIETVALDPAVAGGAIVEAMGFKILFAPGQTKTTNRPRTIKTPTKTLTADELVDATSFPGRTQPGFVGATVIAEGEYDTDTKVFNADFITVEPAETVLLGAVTENSAGPPRVLRINGVEISMLTDGRLCSNPDNPAAPVFLNQYGFPIRPDSITLSPVGPNPPTPPPPSSVEGYFALGKFHAFLFEFGDTGKLVSEPAITPQVSSERAQIRDGGPSFAVEARGAVTTSHFNAGGVQRVDIFRLDLDPFINQWVETPAPLGSADMDVREVGFERWRFRRESVAKTGANLTLPQRLRIKNMTAIDPATGKPAFIDVETDIRDA